MNNLGFRRDMLQKGLNLPVTLSKEPNGDFTVKVVGQEDKIFATAPTEREALQKLNALAYDKLVKEGVHEQVN